MTGNPLSGHTNANLAGMSGTGDAFDGLTDGDHILSPSLTNVYEGVHGNGILLLEDTATGATNRSQPENLPGICEQKTNTYTVGVLGGYCVLDSVLYAFGGGTTSTSDVDFVSGSYHKTGSPSALIDGQEALIVVYLSTKHHSDVQHIYWEMGSAVTTGANVYPVTPSAFLNEPSGASLNSKQTVVLATVRVVFSSGGGDLKISISEINDKRVFLKPSPIYFTPVTTGAVAATDAVDSHTDLANVIAGSDEIGGLQTSPMGALWQSFGTQISSTTAGDNAKDVLYYSATHAARYTRSVFDRVLTSTATSIDLTSTDANILILTPGGSFTVTTSGPFPAGYVIEIQNLHASNTGTFALTNSTTDAIDDSAHATNGYARYVCITSHLSDPTFVRIGVF